MQLLTTQFSCKFRQNNKRVPAIDFTGMTTQQHNLEMQSNATTLLDLNVYWFLCILPAGSSGNGISALLTMKESMEARRIGEKTA